MTPLISNIRLAIRAVMRRIAGVLNTASGGKLSPDAVTIVGCLAHIPIAILIATGHPLWAAPLLVVFGLFDTLDGELARLQGRSSARGMLLDASTDRFKEVLLYIGIAYNFDHVENNGMAAWAVAALGASLCVSYVKAKGEAAIAASGDKIGHSELNKLFADGLLTFEVRIFLLVVGLLSGYLAVVVIAIAILSSMTAIARLTRISRKL